MLTVAGCSWHSASLSALPTAACSAWPAVLSGSAGARHRNACSNPVQRPSTRPVAVAIRLTKFSKTITCGDRNDKSKHDRQPGYKASERRALLNKFVQEVQPQIMEQFTQQAPPQVVNAMKQTITNMLGTLPPQFFGVTISTVGENLAQLMFSVMMTGYMFRNAQYRMEMCKTLTLLPGPTAAGLQPVPPALPAPPNSALSPSPPTSGSLYVPGLPVTNITRTNTPAASAPTSTSFSGSEPRFGSTGSSSIQPDGSLSRAGSTGISSSSLSSVGSDESVSGGAAADGAIVSSSGGGNPGVGVSRQGALSGRDFLNDDDYAPGVQKTRVSGEVLRWHHSKGVESCSAVEYMELLEAEVALLRSQLARQAGPLHQEHNELLEYMKTLEPINLQELTSGAEKDAADAMHSFIHRLLGTGDTEELRSTSSECTAPELAKLLFWLMVVGYSLRTTEVRYEMEKALDPAGTTTSSSNGSNKELPPGR